jgi:hypothetical protein
MQSCLKGGVEPETEAATPDEGLIRLCDASGKMELLDKMMVKLKEQGHRVLIYSKFQLDLLEYYLISRVPIASMIYAADTNHMFHRAHHFVIYVNISIQSNRVFLTKTLLRKVWNWSFPLESLSTWLLTCYVFSSSPLFKKKQISR